SFGRGKTEISIRKITSKKPEYSLRTIQPLTQLNDDSTEFAFVQAQLNSGENFGSRRSTLNLGVGYRQILEQGQSIAGVNLFADYESKSKHKRGSVGLEYQRANFNLNVNRYFPISDKKVIGAHTEEASSGYDVKFLGQVPYLPWVKVKATRYVWNGVALSDVKGTIFGIEVQLSDSVRMEFGSEDNNTVERKTYARFTTALPLSSHESMTNFSIGKKAFQNSGIVNLGDLEFVERSNKIRIEKLLNGLPIVLGEYNAPTEGAKCTLYNSSGVALGTASTGGNGQVNLVGVMNIPAGLVTMTCTGGTYTDEATQTNISAPAELRAATIYSGTGSLTILASPLSEVAYQMADTNNGDRTVIATDIMQLNTAVATAFGVLNGINIISTIPSNANAGPVANDDAGKVGATLAIISQMAATSGKTATEVISDLKDAIKNKTLSAELSSAMSAFQRGVSVAAGKTSIKGNVDNVFGLLVDRAILKISLYNGEGDPVPTVRDYEDIGINSVAEKNIKIKNLRIAAEKDRTKKDSISEIRDIISFQSKASFKINLIAVASVAEKDAFTSPTPTLTGADRVGAVTWAFSTKGGSGKDASMFTISATTGVISMSKRDYENPLDEDMNNVYEVTIIATDSDKNTASKDLKVTVTDVHEFVSGEFSFDGVTYKTVHSPNTNRVWLDRNLGASQVAKSRSDQKSYGDLYQWGRAYDQHEKRTSGTSSTQFTSLENTGVNNGPFIIGHSDWTSADSAGKEREKSWGKPGGGLCPAPFKIPSMEELEAEMKATNITNAATAFSSFLKIPSAGYRAMSSGVVHTNSSVLLWTRSPVPTPSAGDIEAHYFIASNTAASFHTMNRSFGLSIRCISINDPIPPSD
ncbi:inverse autotransporter beta domain-containing protein, partial [thiotrophic endosymbiont of Bathymodiolus puteoserpentis (Logatchev)]|uniref:inverse autotransporter beta domain-containing protein n=1 Tax=thiotrophic endosymbiont of Bathymodiolus puteoserpentis (Logatchev) TaxID=343240 RepID=UPI0010B42210